MTVIRSVPRPPGFYVTTQDGDTLAAIAARYSVEVERVWELNNRARRLEFKRERFPFHFWAKQDAAVKTTAAGLSLEEALARPLRAGQRIFVPNESTAQQARAGKRDVSKSREVRPSAPQPVTQREKAKVQVTRAGSESVQPLGRTVVPDASNSAPTLKGMTVSLPIAQHSGTVIGTVGTVDFFLGIFAVLIGFYSARLMLPRSSAEPDSSKRPPVSAVLYKQLVGLVQASLTITVLIGLAISALVERLRMILQLALKACGVLFRGLWQVFRLIGNTLLVIGGGASMTATALLGFSQWAVQALLFSAASVLLLAWRSAAGLWSAASSRSAAVLERLANERSILSTAGNDAPLQASETPGSPASGMATSDSFFAVLRKLFLRASDGDYVRCILRERIQLSDAYIRMRFDLPNPNDEFALLMGQRLEVQVRKSRQSLWSEIHPSHDEVSLGASTDIRPHRLALASDRHQRGSFDIIVPVSRALRTMLSETTETSAGHGDLASAWATEAYSSAYDPHGNLQVLEKPHAPGQTLPSPSVVDSEFDEPFLIALESLVEGVDTIQVRPAPDTELVYRRASNPAAGTVVVHNVALLASGLGIVPAVRMAEELLGDPESAVSRVTLIYYNERAQDFILLDELERMTKAFGEQFRLHCIWNENTSPYPSRPGITANSAWSSTRIAAATKVMPAMPAWTEGTMAIICGNEAFSQDMWQALCDSGYPEDAITLA